MRLSTIDYTLQREREERTKKVFYIQKAKCSTHSKLTLKLNETMKKEKVINKSSVCKKSKGFYFVDAFL
jgi:hypothetical protein